MTRELLSYSIVVGKEVPQMYRNARNYRRQGGHKYGKGQKKAMNQKAFTGMNARVFVNKDDPNYKPSYGSSYTERQKKIMNGELTPDEFTQGELTLLSRKAERLEDEEALEKIAVIPVFRGVQERRYFRIKGCRKFVFALPLRDQLLAGLRWYQRFPASIWPVDAAQSQSSHP